MRSTPLLKFSVVICILLVGWGSPLANDVTAQNVSFEQKSGFQASTSVEGTVIGPATESTVDGPAVELSRTTVGPFDLSMLVVLFLGTFGLIWVRRYVNSI